MRRLMTAAVCGFMVISLASCRDSAADAATMQELQDKADRYEIDQIEKHFHEATTKKDIDEMMSLWAPNATMTVGPGETAAGLDEIRQVWLTKSTSF